MRRVLIFGNSGSGKSTLAKRLVEEEGLAHLDLDTLAWLPSVPPQRAPLSSSQEKIDQFAGAHDSWVIEGCYSDLLALVSPLATEAIFMNPDMEQCVENARRRPWEPHKYESKEAQDKNLAMLIDWIRQYRERDDVFSFRAHLGLYEKFEGRKSMRTKNEGSA